MPRKHEHTKARCRAFVANHVRKHLQEKISRDQAVAIALEEARKEGCEVPPRP